MASAPRLVQVLSHEMRGPLLTFSHLAPALLEALALAPEAQGLAHQALREAQALEALLRAQLPAAPLAGPDRCEPLLTQAQARLQSLQALTRQAQACCPDAPALGQARDWLRQLAGQWVWMEGLLAEALPAAWSALSPSLQADPVDVVQLLSDLHALMAPRAHDLGLDWTLDLATLPATLRTHAQALRQVLLNLLGNALKYTPTGGVRLAARWQPALDPDAKGSGHLLLEVVDTGLGMDAAQQAAAFEPGVRWHRDHAEGHGLGLAVVKAWTDRLGVTLSVQSAPGQGTTVRLIWPMQTA